MAQITLETPAENTFAPNTRPEASAERGSTWKFFFDSVVTMLTELYARNGQTEVDFGAFPGVSDASLAVTGQTNILAGSVVDCWIIADATDDHSADEHIANPPRVYAGNIAAGVGFTIYGVNDDRGDQLTYGKWTVGWRWQ